MEKDNEKDSTGKTSSTTDQSALKYIMLPNGNRVYVEIRKKQPVATRPVAIVRPEDMDDDEEMTVKPSSSSSAGKGSGKGTTKVVTVETLTNSGIPRALQIEEEPMLPSTVFGGNKEIKPAFASYAEIKKSRIDNFALKLSKSKAAKTEEVEVKSLKKPETASPPTKINGKYPKLPTSTIPRAFLPQALSSSSSSSSSKNHNKTKLNKPRPPESSSKTKVKTIKPKLTVNSFPYQKQQLPINRPTTTKPGTTDPVQKVTPRMTVNLPVHNPKIQNSNLKNSSNSTTTTKNIPCTTKKIAYQPQVIKPKYTKNTTYKPKPTRGKQPSASAKPTLHPTTGVPIPNCLVRDYENRVGKCPVVQRIHCQGRNN